MKTQFQLAIKKIEEKKKENPFGVNFYNECISIIKESAYPNELPDFSYTQIEQLQSKVYDIVGKGDLTMEYEKRLSELDCD